MKEAFRRVLAWFDEYFLLYMSVFLLFFIPLWPKIPLASILPGYIVRLRLEDVLVFITFVIYLIQMWRGKVRWRMPTWQLIAAYVAFGFLSILTGIFVIHTIPFDLKDGVWSISNVLVAGVHVAKSFLHWARYIEYFFLAFVFYSSIKNKKVLPILSACLVTTVMAVSVYGWGQKYLYWPVYSTMNREFSKGVALRLTEHARVQSTFGGHYDFAAYLVLLLPFAWLIARESRKIWPGAAGKFMRVYSWLAHFAGVWSLIISAARTSFLAYGVSMLLMFALDVFLRSGEFKQKMGAWLWQQVVYFVIVLVIMFGWGGDIVERFEHPFDRISLVHNSYQALVAWRQELPGKLGWKQRERPEGVEMGEFVMDEQSVLTPTDTQPSPIVSDNPPAQEFVTQTPTQIESESEGAATKMYELDTRDEGASEVVETTAQESPAPNDSLIPEQDFGESQITDANRPADVYVDVPDLLTAYDASGNAYTYEAPRTWSANAEKYGLSMAIRLDTLWPNAIAGFSRNPLLGSGYGTLTKGDSLTVFTEADSTDCNYLRTLGETGLLGFICFYGAIVWALISAWRHRLVTDPIYRTLILAYFGGMIGILVNALYIDVFVASKVAFTVWMLTGIFWASVRLIDKKSMTVDNA